MAKDFIKYVSSDPTTRRVAVYRIVLVVIVCLTLLGIVSIRNQQSKTAQQVETIATAVAP